MSQTGKSYALGTVLIVLMFAIWGLSHRLYSAILPGFITSLSLTEFQVSVADWVRTLGYCAVAIPSAFFLRNFGFKAGAVGGLGCFAIAMFMFYPAELQHSYVFFLAAGLLANCGVALLEIAADPWVMKIGPAESAIRRLNIAQALNPIGLLIGMLLGSRAMSHAAGQQIGFLAHIPVQPYILIGTGLLLFAYLIDNTKFSPEATERVAKNDRTVDDVKQLLSLSDFRLGLGALALYIAGHTVLWGFAARYAQHAVPGMTAAAAADIMLWTLYAFIIGRVAGAILMYRFDPGALLVTFGGAAAFLTAAAVFIHGWPGIWCIVGASFFMSILFPTIFGFAVQDVDKHTKSASALLIMASGSANLALPTISLVLGAEAVPYIVLLPSLCFGLITVHAVMRRHGVHAKIDPATAVHT